MEQPSLEDNPYFPTVVTRITLDGRTYERTSAIDPFLLSHPVARARTLEDLRYRLVTEVLADVQQRLVCEQQVMPPRAVPVGLDEES